MASRGAPGRAGRHERGRPRVPRPERVGPAALTVMYCLMLRSQVWSVRAKLTFINLPDVGEIYSRLLDHRPVIQGEIRYFVKEFEEKRGLRELRVLENLKKTIFETNESILPKCEQSMHDNLNEVFQRCKQVASYLLCCIIWRDGINSLDSK
uniref:Biogenesis of lysosome-related organelles complex 1 subunit 5 n=1 Tax=Pavo cristatus TaxID=9049 RepID=A0A8C9FYR9_PAVCR